MIDPSRHHLLRRSAGVALILVGLLALGAPIATGKWSLQLLGVPLLVIGLRELYWAVSVSGRRLGASVTGLLALMASLLMFVSPAFIVSGLLILLLVFLALDGGVKLWQAFLGDTLTSRAVASLNGVASLFLAGLVYFLWRHVDVPVAIGLAVGGYTVTTGWSMLFSRESAEPAIPEANAADGHPDSKLGLGAQEVFRLTRDRLTVNGVIVRRLEIGWLAEIALILLVIHLVRMQSRDTWLGLISPIVATLGDAVMALLLGLALLLPLRLIWRRITRRIERAAWRLRIDKQADALHPVIKKALNDWTDGRFAFALGLQKARVSLYSALALALRLGLPAAALFVAINPIWGFNWYFNTESWASGIYQKVTELRVDSWRKAMVDAIAQAYGGNNDDLFRVHPEGIEGQDFSFIVVGDPGEGDASQYALANRYIELGRRDDIKFLIVSSDVIYPAGAIANYEQNFYLPFKGFTKPIYAIPGNHDWFDALEGFNANFLEPKAARVALAARVRADLHLTSTNEDRIERLLKQGAELRKHYQIDNAKQRAPFFELQTDRFALIAIDTGILRTVDERQLAWIKRSLGRNRGKFTLAILGHPRFAAGSDTSAGDEKFVELYQLLASHGVQVAMAGDTHDFEYYAEPVAIGETTRTMHHFVNGGGGAYLSIGSALDWSTHPATDEWCFYPKPELLRAKLDAETPIWKRPFWLWIKQFGAWPLSTEVLSGMFDFNHAPFFQSFMEVRVESSKNRVVFVLHGVNGSIKWRDLHLSASSPRRGASLDDPVQFIVPAPAKFAASTKAN